MISQPSGFLDVDEIGCGDGATSRDGDGRGCTVGGYRMQDDG